MDNKGENKVTEKHPFHSPGAALRRSAGGRWARVRAGVVNPSSLLGHSLHQFSASILSQLPHLARNPVNPFAHPLPSQPIGLD